MLFWLVSCVISAPSDPVDLAPAPVAPPTGPPGPTTTLPLPSDLPTLHLTVDPLLDGTLPVLQVDDAPPGATVGFWRGGLGGSTCPAELTSCLDVAGAALIGEVVADGAGLASLPWIVPAGEDGTYPVFQAAIADPAARSQVVMRRIDVSWPPAAPVSDGLSEQDPETLSLPPGDYYELGNTVYAPFPVRGGTHVEAEIVLEGGFSGQGYWSFYAEDPLAEEIADGSRWSSDVRDTSVVAAWVQDEYLPWAGWVGPYSLHVTETLPATPHDWTADADLDGYGDGSPVVGWLAPDGYVWRDGDCDDEDEVSHPSATDVCEDGVDQDCTGADRSCFPALGGDQRIEDVAFAVATADRGVQQLAAAGDRDGDGLADLILTDETTATLWGEPARGPATPDSRLTEVCCWGRMDAASPGDVDGDGRADLLIADYAADDYAGAVYLITATLTGDQPAASVARSTIAGTADTKLQAVGEVGDTDGDGVPDVLVATTHAGAYLFQHLPAGLVSVDDADATLLSPSLGSDVGGADLDGDGISELVISKLNTGEVWIVPGPFVGVIDADQAGVAVTGATDDYELDVAIGDLDGDGAPDLAAPMEYGYGVTVAFGPFPAGGTFGALTVDDARSFAIPGDLDGDGVDELAVGNPDLVNASGRTGLVGVFAGPVPTGAHSVGEGDAVWSGDQIGRALGGPGDLDGDGLDDLGVGAPTEAWLIHGAGF